MSVSMGAAWDRSTASVAVQTRRRALRHMGLRRLSRQPQSRESLAAIAKHPPGFSRRSERPLVRLSPTAPSFSVAQLSGTFRELARLALKGGFPHSAQSRRPQQEPRIPQCLMPIPTPTS
jgi:hypothetical protein